MSQYGTTVFLDGRAVRQSRNLQGLLSYGREVSPVFRVTAAPCPDNQYNGKLRIEYENGATCSAHFASYTMLLEWLHSRRSWRVAPFWSVAKPSEALRPAYTRSGLAAWERLDERGLTGRQST